MDENVKDRLIPLADGSLVEQDTLRIAEKIAEYDPNLRLKYCPPEVADMTDAPYAIFERCRDGLERLVFYVWTLDDRVLERIYLADNAHRNVLDEIEKNNIKVQAQELQRYKDKIAEGGDITKSFLKSRKGRWSFYKDDGTKVTLDDGAKNYQKKVRPE